MIQDIVTMFRVLIGAAAVLAVLVGGGMMLTMAGGVLTGFLVIAGGLLFTGAAATALKILDTLEAIHKTLQGQTTTQSTPMRGRDPG